MKKYMKNVDLNLNFSCYRLGTWLLHYWQLKHSICQYWESKYRKCNLVFFSSKSTKSSPTQHATMLQNLNCCQKMDPSSPSGQLCYSLGKGSNSPCQEEVFKYKTSPAFYIQQHPQDSPVIATWAQVAACGSARAGSDGTAVPSHPPPCP